MARVGAVVLGVLAMVSSALPAYGQSLPASGGQDFAVAVHARSTRASARAEHAAWLSLTLPLDRFALPRPIVRTATPAAPSEAGSSQPEPSTAEPAPRAAPTQDEAEREPTYTLEQLRALSELSRRATVVALAVAGAAADRRRLDALSTRSRWSAVLPELRLRAQRNTDQALRWAPTSDDPYRVTQADGAGTTLEASATFRLDRLLFSREELAVERLRVQAGQERLKLERRVLEAVLGLFRARELGCAEGVEEEARALQNLRSVELFAELDVLTAGWFSEHAPEHARAVWGFPEALLGQCRPPAPPNAAPSLGAPPPARASATKPVASLGDSE